MSGDCDESPNSSIPLLSINLIPRETGCWQGHFFGCNIRVVTYGKRQEEKRSRLGVALNRVVLHNYSQEFKVGSASHQRGGSGKATELLVVGG